MNIIRDKNPKRDSDWVERLIIIWEEDDAPVPDKERHDEAWLRIRGRVLGDEKVVDHIDAGDAVYTLYSCGWVCVATCEGTYIAVVAKVNE